SLSIRDGDPTHVVVALGVLALLVADIWLDRRQQAAELRRWKPPPAENYPASAAVRHRWGTEEQPHQDAPAARSAPEAAWGSFWGWVGRWGAPRVESAPARPVEAVPCFVVYEGHDPDILEARPYTVVDAVLDAREEAVAAGLSHEDTVEHLAAAL